MLARVLDGSQCDLWEDTTFLEQTYFYNIAIYVYPLAIQMPIKK